MSRVTLPIEKGCEELVLELIKLWGADAIRNSDGTKLNDFFENLDAKIYSTYFPAREDQDWPRENPEEIQHQALISERYTAFNDTLEIDPMEGYYKEQLEIDEKTTDYWQVFDRTTNSLVPKENWIFDGNVVKIGNALKFHEYTVNFFAKQTWDTTHMYNHMTNNWNSDKSIPYDIVFDKTREHIYSHLKNGVIEILTLMLLDSQLSFIILLLCIINMQCKNLEIGLVIQHLFLLKCLKNLKKIKDMK